MATLGPYQIGDSLTRLALGEVVATSHPARSELLALLLVDDRLAADYRFRGLLRLEVARAGGVRHPALARTIEVGEHDRRLYAVLHWPSGTPLCALPPEPWPPERALAAVRSLAEALDRAHDRRIVHGDLTPAAVIVAADGTPTLIGLGLLAAVEQSGHTADLPRDPDWTPPEQRAGAPSDPASDRYALGRLATLLLTGQPALRDQPNTSEAAQSAAWAVLARQTSPSPAERYPTTIAFADALAEALTAPGRTGTPATAPPAAPPLPPASAIASPSPERPPVFPTLSRPAALGPEPVASEPSATAPVGASSAHATAPTPVDVSVTSSSVEALAMPAPAEAAVLPAVADAVGATSAAEAVAMPATTDAAVLDTASPRPAARRPGLPMDWAPPSIWPPLPNRAGERLEPAERTRFIRQHALVGAVVVALLGLSCTVGTAPSPSSLVGVVLFGTIMYAGGGALIGALVGYLRLAAAEAGTSTSTIVGEQIAAMLEALARERTSEHARRDLPAEPPVRSSGTAYLWQDRDGGWWLKAPNGSNLQVPPQAGRRIAVAAGGARDGALFGLAGITSYRVLDAADVVVSADGTILLLVMDQRGQIVYRDPRFQDTP